MTRTIAMLATCLLAQAGLAQESPVPEQPSAVEQASEKASAPADAATADKAGDEFKPPRGFQTKKRGDLVLYCKKDSTVGTRFKTEKCYDEKQMREYMLALEMQKNDVDRIRGTCGGGTACNMPDPTRQ